MIFLESLAQKNFLNTKNLCHTQRIKIVPQVK